MIASLSLKIASISSTRSSIRGLPTRYNIHPFNFVNLLNQNPFQMIQLMLTDLRWPAAELLSLFFPVHIIIFHFDIFISCRFSHTGKRQASFFCFIRSILAQKNRIKHHNIYESHIYNDCSLFHTNHFVLRTQSRARSHAYMPA